MAHEEIVAILCLYTTIMASEEGSRYYAYVDKAPNHVFIVLIKRKKQDSSYKQASRVDTSVLWTVFFVPGESPSTFSLNSTRLIRTLVNVDNEHLFLAQ